MAFIPSESIRYEGKPLLRLLELYVLWAVSELSESDERKLHQMTPKLSQVYQHEGDWHDILAFVMKFPTTFPSLIVETWQQNQTVAKVKNLELTPQQFAEMFVDQNLV